MSKKLIAGAGVVASFAIALAPLATFADASTLDDSASDTHTDELVLTINSSCTFGRGTSGTTGYVDGVSHGEVTGTTWNESDPETDETDAPYTHSNDDVDSDGTDTASEHTAYRSIDAGTTATGFATTTLNVVCNSNKGYTIKAAAANLSNGTAADEDIAANSAAVSATSSSYKGNLTVPTGATKVADVVTSSDVVIATKATVSAETGDAYTVSYDVGIGKNQKAATYAGKVVYTLFQGLPASN